MKILEIKCPREIDHRTAEKLSRELRGKIASERPRRLILDFSEVTMMDSSGIGLILGRYKQMKEIGGEIFVKNTTRQADRILTLSGLYQIIGKWEGRDAS